MKFEAKLLTCDFLEDTLTLQLKKGFWKEGLEIMAGTAIVETNSIRVRDAQPQGSERKTSKHG